MSTTKATADRYDRLVSSLRRGLPFASACQRAGIATITGWKWRREDQHLRERCDMAESYAEAKLVQELLRGGIDKDTGLPAFPDAVRSQNIRWFLERRWPAKYGTGVLREKAYDRELEESKGEAGATTMTPELQAALIEFAKARTDEEQWQAFLKWREMDRLVEE